VGQKKTSLKESVFVNSALKVQCHVVKNTLLERATSHSSKWFFSISLYVDMPFQQSTGQNQCPDFSWSDQCLGGLPFVVCHIYKLNTYVQILLCSLLLNFQIK